MTMQEWSAEYQFHAEQSPEYKKSVRIAEMAEDLELSDEEWWAKHGTPGN